MFTVFIILIVVVSVLLIASILLQDPKEQSLVYGGATQQVQRVAINPKANFLEKATWILIGGLLTLTMLAAVVLKRRSQDHLPLSPNLAKLHQEKSLDKELSTHQEEDRNHSSS